MCFVNNGLADKTSTEPGLGKHWIVFSSMQRFAWLPQGRPQGKQKIMRAGVRKNDDFFAIVVRITGKLLWINSWHTKCAVSSEREGLRTSNLVDGRSEIQSRNFRLDSARLLCDSWASCWCWYRQIADLTVSQILANTQITQHIQKGLVSHISTVNFVYIDHIEYINIYIYRIYRVAQKFGTIFW